MESTCSERSKPFDATSVGARGRRRHWRRAQEHVELSDLDRTLAVGSGFIGARHGRRRGGRLAVGLRQPVPHAPRRARGRPPHGNDAPALARALRLQPQTARTVAAAPRRLAAQARAGAGLLVVGAAGGPPRRAARGAGRAAVPPRAQHDGRRGAALARGHRGGPAREGGRAAALAGVGARRELPAPAGDLRGAAPAVPHAHALHQGVVLRVAGAMRAEPPAVLPARAGHGRPAAAGAGVGLPRLALQRALAVRQRVAARPGAAAPSRRLRARGGAAQRPAQQAWALIRAARLARGRGRVPADGAASQGHAAPLDDRQHAGSIRRVGVPAEQAGGGGSCLGSDALGAPEDEFSRPARRGPMPAVLEEGCGQEAEGSADSEELYSAYAAWPAHGGAAGVARRSAVRQGAESTRVARHQANAQRAAQQRCVRLVRLCQAKQVSTGYWTTGAEQAQARCVVSRLCRMA